MQTLSSRGRSACKRLGAHAHRTCCIHDCRTWLRLSFFWFSLQLDSLRFFLSLGAESHMYLFWGACSAWGFQFLLQKIGAIRRFGVLFLSPPCSSWVWIARSQSKRSRMNVTGDEARLFVKQGNRVAELLALLMRLCIKLGVYFLVEQPESSLLFSHPDVASVMAEYSFCIYEAKFPMAAFGGSSRKPTVLVGTTPWLADLVRFAQTRSLKNRELTRLAIVKNGRVTGKRAQLQESAAYPHQFCYFLAKQVLSHLQMKTFYSELAVSPLVRKHVHGKASSAIAALVLDFVNPAGQDASTVNWGPVAQQIRAIQFVSEALHSAWCARRSQKYLRGQLP
eukprot:6492546-Amphidinium_carterae.1